MSSEGTPELPATVIALQDGREFRIDADGLHLGEQTYQLEQVEDVRQIAPNPETIGLRIAGAGLITVVPARQGDVAVALEALYSRRPSLRPPASTPTPGMAGPPPPPWGPWPYGPPPPGYVPMPPYGAPAGYPPYPPYGLPPGYGPPPYGYPPGGGQGAPGARRGALGPWPQSIGDVIGSSFRLYGRNFRQFALLGLAVAVWPALMIGLLQVGYYYMLGFDPLKGLVQNVYDNLRYISPPPGETTPAPFRPPRFLTMTPQQLAAVIGAATVLVLLMFVLNAWQAGALGIAARESVFGRPVRIGEAIKGGLSRLLPVLGTTLLVGLIIGAAAVAAYVAAIGAITLSIGLIAFKHSQGPSAGSTILLTVLFGIAVYICALIGAIYLSVRLQFAPYAVASDRLSPGRAIARSWTLTRGNWWRSFLPVLVVGLAVGFAASVVSPVMFISLAGMCVIALPLFTAILTPLSITTVMVIYYDLRVRHEGYGALAHEFGLPEFPPPGPPGPFAPPAAPPQTDGPTQSDQSPGA